MASSLSPIRPTSLEPEGTSSVPASPWDTGRLRPEESVQDGGAALAGIFQALRRFRWLIFALTLTGTAVGLLITRYVDPAYVVSATIWVEPPQTERDGAPIQGERLLRSAAWLQLLTTYVVLDPVVRERKLYLSGARGEDSSLFRGFDLDSRFLPGKYDLIISEDGKRYDLKPKRQVGSEQGAIGDSVGRRLGFLWVPRPARSQYGRSVTFQVLTPREASDELKTRLEPVLQEETFLQLRFTDTDAEEAAATLNSLIRRYVDEAANQKRSRLTMLAQVLDSQVIEQAERLRNAEETLESFRVGTVTKPREDQSQVPAGLTFTQPTVYTEFFKMRTTRDEIRRDRRALEDVLAQVKRGEQSVDAFHTIPAARNAPELLAILKRLSDTEASLRDSLTRYTENWPGIKSLRERIETLRTQTVPLYADALVKQLGVQEEELTTRITAMERELQEIPTRTQTEARLRREVDQADGLFRQLSGSRQAARLAEASAIPDVRIVDSADVPSEPSRNQTARLILLGLLGGLGAGLALSVVLDKLDRRVRYPEQVSAGLGLPILGTIPRVRQHGGSVEEAAQVVEAFRSVRLNLMHCFQPGGGLAMVISSPSPGDGKSLVSSNLALSFAEAGFKTVLVDGDIRRGDLHRTFDAERRPGLLDYLSGDQEVAAVFRPTTHQGLTLIPCGARRRQGPELLGSPRMHDLIAVLRSRYEVVIVDSPPLGAGIDPFVLATATGNMAIVLRAGETDRQLAEAKLQVLDRLPVRLLGAIMNDVRVGEGAYKYYSYTYGYLSADEEAGGALPAAETKSS